MRDAEPEVWQFDGTERILEHYITIRLEIVEGELYLWIAAPFSNESRGGGQEGSLQRR
jgi:hypothetical protein